MRRNTTTQLTTTRTHAIAHTATTPTLHPNPPHHTTINHTTTHHTDALTTSHHTTPPPPPPPPHHTTRPHAATTPPRQAENDYEDHTDLMNAQMERVLESNEAAVLQLRTDNNILKRMNDRLRAEKGHDLAKIDKVRLWNMWCATMRSYNGRLLATTNK